MMNLYLIAYSEWNNLTEYLYNAWQLYPVFNEKALTATAML